MASKSVAGTRKPRIQTMKELSLRIGVSRPTLARYFEDSESVLPSTVAKIEKGLAEVDYVYNFLATRQNRKSTGLIGVVVPQYKDLFFASLLDSIETSAQSAGFTTITQSSKGNQETEANAVAKLRSMNVDGAIIAPLGFEESDRAFQSASRDFPIVFVDSRPASVIQGADFVGTGNAGSIGSIIDYLCRTGDAPIFLRMPGLNSNALEREEAYREKMRDLGFEERHIETDGIASSWRFEEFGYEVMDGHFSRGRYVDATILCANDRVAIGAICAANKYGLFNKKSEARRALRITGHDDHPLSKFMSPALTTIAQDIDGIGNDAIRLLVERTRDGRDGDPVYLLKDSTLKLRDSV